MATRPRVHKLQPTPSQLTNIIGMAIMLILAYVVVVSLGTAVWEGVFSTAEDAFQTYGPYMTHP